MQITYVNSMWRWPEVVAYLLDLRFLCGGSLWNRRRKDGELLDYVGGISVMDLRETGQEILVLTLACKDDFSRYHARAIEIGFVPLKEVMKKIYDAN